MLSESEEDHEQESNALIARPSFGSAVVDRRNVPNIANLNVSNFSRLHIGDEYITQNIYNGKTVNGKSGPMILLRAKSCIPGFNAIMTMAIVFTTSLILVLFYVTSAGPGRLDTGLNETWYLRRSYWQAFNELTLEYLQLPLKYVLIGHAAEHYCVEKFSCIKEVLDIQRNNLIRGWSDIGPNYLISSNGLIFEGRGANILGYMVKKYDHESISVMFLGHYEHDSIVKEQFDHLGTLVKQLVKLKILDQDYTIIAHCQIDDWTISPGLHVIQGLRTFTRWDNITHWDNFNESLCLRSESELAK